MSKCKMCDEVLLQRIGGSGVEILSRNCIKWIKFGTFRQKIDRYLSKKKKN